jgi:hypothetical protein
MTLGRPIIPPWDVIDIEEIILYIISRSSPDKFSKSKLEQYLILLQLKNKIGLIVEANRYGAPAIRNFPAMLKQLEEKKLLHVIRKKGSVRTFFQLLPKPVWGHIPAQILDSINALLIEWDDKEAVKMQKEVKGILQGITP